MTNRYKIGDRVRVLYEPVYWDQDDNQNAWDDDDSDAIDPDEHPGFNSSMCEMVGSICTIELIGNGGTWVGLRSEEDDLYWFHTDWLSHALGPAINLSDVDKASKYIKVITKIKHMDAKRKDKGYAF